MVIAGVCLYSLWYPSISLSPVCIFTEGWMSEGREKCFLARVLMSVGILWLFHWRNGPPWRGLLTEWWDSGSQHSAKRTGRTFFFPTLLSCIRKRSHLYLMNAYWIQDALMSFIIFVCFEMNFNKCLFICCGMCLFFLNCVLPTAL